MWQQFLITAIVRAERQVGDMHNKFARNNGKSGYFRVQGVVYLQSAKKFRL